VTKRKLLRKVFELEVRFMGAEINNLSYSALFILNIEYSPILLQEGIERKKKRN